MIDIESGFKHHITLVGFAFTLALVTAFTFIYLSLNGYSQLHSTWQQQSAKSAHYMQALAAVRHHFGYGGFIHNFKNLVIRADIPRYVPLIERDISQLNDNFATLRSLLQRPEHLTALRAVEDTFELYQQSYHLAVELIAQNIPIAEVDTRVKVDDDSALAALTLLGSYHGQLQQQLQTETSMLKSNARTHLLTGSAVLISSLVCVAFLMLYLMKKLIKTTQVSQVLKEDLNQLLANAPDAIFSISSSGKIFRANNMACQLFGARREQLLQQTVSQLLPLDGSAEGSFKHYLQNLNSKLTANQNILTVNGRNGQQQQLEIRLAQTRLANDIATILIMRDVTEQQLMKQALLDAKQQAEQNLASQQAMQQELVQAEKMAALGRLVAGVAHEINTPVGIMLTAASHLYAKTSEASLAFQQKSLSASQLTQYLQEAEDSSGLIVSSCSRASELIQSFKLVAVDQSADEIRDFDLAIYLNEILQSLQPSFKNRPIRCHICCAPELILHSYPGTLAQIISNLVINSLRHAFKAEQSGLISIRARLLDEPTNWLELVYEDNGQGIPTALHNKVFEPFFTTSRQQGGSGLGLHIVYTAVTQMLQGSITLSSIEGQGSCFIIRIPKTTDALISNNISQAQQ